MKRKNSIMFIIISVIFFILMYFTSIQIIANNNLFFEAFFEKYNIYDKRGISINDSTYVINVLVDYMEGKTKTLKLNRNILGFDNFSSRETKHMVDVRNLYQTFKILRNISCIIYAIGLFIYKKNNNKRILKNSIISFIIANVFFLGITITLISNFNLFWQNFHKIAFSNESWLLDYSKDLMINVCSNEMFETIIISSLGIYMIISILYLISIFIYEKYFLIEKKQFKT